MPPIPFAPSHTSPFKSTLSSSQQERRNHFLAPESSQLSIRDLESAQWNYHCEGGKNVLLSLQPQATPSKFVLDGRPLALRIGKTASGAWDKTDELDEFTQEIIVPLLGNQQLLPIAIRLALRDSRDRSIIETLAASIELHRPHFRRVASARINADALSHVHVIEDVTAPSIIDHGNTLCVEIKPKWGYLPRTDSLPFSSPNIHIKSNYSRYRMHRVAKAMDAGHVMTAEQFDELYDPLDLYSAEERRMTKAITALYKDWRTSQGATNNLRLFWNGKIVAPDDGDLIAEIERHLISDSRTETSSEDNLLEGLVAMLIRELSKPQVPPLHTAQPLLTVLDRLAYLQSQLDPLDVEGLAKAWLEVAKSETLGDLAPDQSQLDPESTSLLTSPPTVDDLKHCLTDILGPGPVSCPPRTPAQSLSKHIHRFLLSSSFKDCSLLIRCDKSEEGVLMSSTKVIDLDLKPISKLPSFQITDTFVCSRFARWKSTLASEPAISRKV